MAIRSRGYSENLWDDEAGAARLLRRTALLGIAARLFFIGVCAFRTWSLDHPPRDGFGHFGPADLVGHGNDASMLLTIALWASYLTFALFLLALVSLLRHKLRGGCGLVRHRRNPVPERPRAARGQPQGNDRW